MTSIQQQAAELAEEWKNSDCSNLRELERNGDKMAALLRQIASMGGDVEPMTLQELDCYLDPTDSPGPGKVYCQQALDAARLAGFEAGRRKELEEQATEDDGPHFKYRTVHVDDYQQIAQMKLEGWYENGPVSVHGYKPFALELKESPASAPSRDAHAFERNGYAYRYVRAGDALEMGRMLAEGWGHAPPEEQMPLNGVFATLLRRPLPEQAK